MMPNQEPPMTISFNVKMSQADATMLKTEAASQDVHVGALLSDIISSHLKVLKLRRHIAVFDLDD